MIKTHLRLVGRQGKAVNPNGAPAITKISGSPSAAEARPSDAANRKSLLP
jgi:hypothetical protein